MKYPKFLFLLIAVLEMNTAISQTKEINSMDSLTDLFIAHNCFNGEALVTKNNKPIYSTTVGFRDNTFKEKITQNSIFNIGSISKPFTSVAILQLQQKKLLNIEDNVKKYIPNFPYDSICIKHLLSHTSGLIGSFDQLDEIDLSSRLNNDSIVNVLIRYDVQLFFPPGSEWGYSNLGYDLLAVIVERVSEMSFSDYMRKNIFIPAGMKNTFIPNTNNIIKFLPNDVSIKNILVPHMFENIASCEVKNIDSVESISTANDYFIGSSNVYSTVFDLAKFDAALRKYKILNHDLQELAYTPFLLTTGDTAKDMRAPIPSYYGLGWFISIDKSWGRILWHKGRSFGSRSVFLRNPSKKQTVTVTDNFDYPGCDLKGIAFMKILNNQPYRNPVYMSLVQKFGCNIYTIGIDAALKEFRRLRANEIHNYYTSEDEIVGLSNVLVNDKKSKDALSVLKLGTEIFPESFSVYLSYAILLFDNNEIEMAIQNYEKSVSYYSTDEMEKENLLNSIGYGFIIENELDHAELVLKLNTELFPKSFNVYDSYASVLEKNNKMELAIFNQEKAVAIATEQKADILPVLQETLKNLKSK
jgi:CubicO group peptidase (beta-lactamase class C family)